MKTKDKILEVALRQFNELGTEQVSIRTIANELEISAGNLCYHFKNTDAIIFQLYLNLVDELGKMVEVVQHPDTDIARMMEETELTFRIMYKYKFLMLDFVAITRRMTELREHFRQIIRLRQQQLRVGIENLVSKELMHQEWTPDMYNHLILHSMMVADAWIPNAEVHFDEKGEPIVQFYSQMMFSMLVPFLTESGLAQYHKALEDRPEWRAGLRFGITFS
ncbi:MAG: TetR family transcriptional regulator [Saprospiraceae bacterium]|nr:TetR family transcriptional regulator [Saprospiraceae bacterium]